MSKLIMTVGIEVREDLTLAANVKRLADKVRGSDLLEIPIQTRDGAIQRTFTISEALSKSRAAAYEQYFSGQVGPELQAIGKLKPTQEAVIKQIQEYYDV